MPPVWHPMVRRHPVTGRKSLFISSIYNDAVEGLDGGRRVVHRRGEGTQSDVDDRPDRERRVLGDGALVGEQRATAQLALVDGAGGAPHQEKHLAGRHVRPDSHGDLHDPVRLSRRPHQAPAVERREDAGRPGMPC